MSEGSGKPSSGRLKRTLKWLLVLPLLLVLLLGLLLWFLLGSSSGSGWLAGAGANWLEKRLPGARVELGSPRALLDGISLQRLELPGAAADDPPQLLLRDLDLAIALRCEPGIFLCINRLSIETLTLAPAASKTVDENKPPREAIALPRIAAPFGVKLFELAITNLGIAGTTANPLLQNIALQAKDIRWRETKLDIAALQADQALWHYALEGELYTEGNYPVDLRHKARLAQKAFAVLATPLSASINSSNSLQELELDVALTGPQGAESHTVNIDALIQPLTNGLPFELRINSTRLDPQAWVRLDSRSNAIAVLHQLAANASGNLAATGGKPVVIDASLQANFESLTNKQTGLPLQLALKLTGTKQLTLKSLTLGEPGNQLAAQGEMSLLDGIAAEFSVEFDKFAPGALLRSAVDTLDGESRVKIDYPPDGFLQVDAVLDAVQLRAGKTSYLASGTVKNDVQQFIVLNGLQVSTSGNHARLDGKLPPLERTALDTQAKLLEWLGAATLDAKLELDDLGKLPIEVLGKADASIQLRPGKPFAIRVHLQNIAADVGAADELQIDASVFPDLSQKSKSRLALQGSGIASNGIVFDQLALQADGNFFAHRFSLAGSGARHSISLDVQGSYASDTQSWRGSVNPSVVVQAQAAGKTAAANRIQIKSPAPITLSIGQQHPRFALEAFCLSINNSELCSDGSTSGSNGVQATAASNTLAFRLSTFDLATLDPIMPARLRWRGTLHGDADVSLAENRKPVVNVSIRGEQGVMQAGGGEAAIAFRYDRIALQGDANEKGITSRLALQRDNKQLLNAALSLSGSNFSVLNGELQLNALPLGLFAPLAPALETLQGELHAQLALSGTTSAPQPGGTLSLASGHIKVANNALELRDINLNGQFSGPSLALDGSFRAGEGRGSMTGNIKFADPVTGRLVLQGEQLRITSEPVIDLLANLDLSAQLQGNMLTVAGEVAIPEGKIEIVELPANAQQLSADVTFVEPDATNSKRSEQTLSISNDVLLVIGPRLAFSGFDASAVLGGQLRLLQKAGATPLGRGEIKILEGKYRGYGQRLDVRRGSLLFNGELGEPNINLEAVRNAEDAVVGIRVSGAANAPDIAPFSEPAMPDDQVIYRIITGRAPGTGSGANQNAIIAQTLISQGIKLGGSSLGDTAEKLGIENFNIGTGDGSDFQVSGYLDPTLYLEYGVNALGDGSTFKLRWDFARRLSVEFIGGLANSLDLFYSREF
ncbi:MAG: translocation/assembly module TamB domain-containing protein [Pseudomonadales bacterium]